MDTKSHASTLSSSVNACLVQNEFSSPTRTEVENVSGPNTKNATYEHPAAPESQEPSAQLLYYSIPLITFPSFSPNLPRSSNNPTTDDELSAIEQADQVAVSNEGVRIPRIYEIQGYDAEPSALDFEHLKFHASAAYGESEAVSPRDRYDLNWLSFDALYRNQHCLCERTCDLLRRFSRSKWDESGWLENGLKTSNGTLPEAILLLISAEVWDNIIPNAQMIIEANLRDRNGRYSYNGGKRRFISPRAAKGRIYKFKRTYAPEKLFPEHHAYMVIFESNSELQRIGHNPTQKREAYEKFFAKNAATLRLWKKERKIRAFFTSHEITCLSILDQTFNPHSHAVIWVDAESDAGFIDAFVEEGNSIKYFKEPRKTYAEVENFIHYLMRAHSLAAVYRREFSYAHAREFNKRTVNALHALVELQTGDGGSRGKQKTHQEGIPKRRG